MKPIKILILIFAGFLFMVPGSFGQANASLNILTLNSGLVNLGGTVYIQVTVGATIGTGGQQGPIPAYKVRAQISTPSSLVSVLPNAQQTGLPPGWTITVNNGSTITVCNGTDVIPVGQSRVILILIQGNTIGGPSTVSGNLLFSNGIVCTTTGNLNGDNLADNISQSSVQVVPAAQCTLTSLTASAGTIACNGGTTILTANSGQPTNVEYRLNSGAFQSSYTFTVNAAGSPYTVTARRISDPGCTVTSNTVNVIEPPELIASASSTPVSVPGGNDGTATVIPDGGTPAYSYLWNPGGQTTQTATGLTEGTYTVTVTDVNACTTTASTTVQVVLPLTLIDFNAKLLNCRPVLNWITETEINTSRFEIERGSISNQDWISLGSVTANSNTTTRINYKFIDSSLNGSSEQVLYRLKMIDKDGHYKYSWILRLYTNCKTSQAQINVYPNPVRNGRLYVSLSGVVGYTKATLVSLSGQVVVKTKMNNGTNYLNTANIADGVYVLNVNDAEGFNKKIKIFIQH